MKSVYVNDRNLDLILQLLTYENRLVCAVALQTGLRVGDIVALKSVTVKRSFTITEQKTGKKRRVKISESLLKELNSVKGKKYVFEHRTDSERHRTRQAVYADIRRACKALRIKQNISPHSLRKHYAVELMKKYGDIDVVKESLNHDNELTTLLYAYADILDKKPKYCGRDKAKR